MITSVPDRIRRLQKYGSLPVPFFVAWKKNDHVVTPFTAGAVPDFRVMSTEALRQCLAFRRCWICAGTLGSLGTFVTGPCSVMQRASAEPPSHRDCAEYAVQVCPFMVDPDRELRMADQPGGTTTVNVVAEHNPGVAATYVTRDWTTQPSRQPGHFEFLMGSPISVSWWRKGRPATRREVLIGMEGSLQDLIAAHGMERVDRMFADLERLLPPERS